MCECTPKPLGANGLAPASIVPGSYNSALRLREEADLEEEEEGRLEAAEEEDGRFEAEAEAEAEGERGVVAAVDHARRE